MLFFFKDGTARLYVPHLGKSNWHAVADRGVQNWQERPDVNCCRTEHEIGRNKQPFQRSIKQGSIEAQIEAPLPVLSQPFRILRAPKLLVSRLRDPSDCTFFDLQT